MNSYLFKNANVVLENEILYNSCVLTNNGKISAVGDGCASFTDDFAEIIDCDGLYLSAGFIDLHTHGGGGYDFMDANVDEYISICKHHRKFGTTSLLATTLTASEEELADVFDAFRAAKVKNIDGAQLLGIHLEGPYISPFQKGAQDEKYIKDPVFEDYDRLLSMSDDIKRITVAVELDGALEMGKYLSAKGILPSIGHTNATTEQVIKGFYYGKFNLLTHFYSGMSMTHRIGINRVGGAVEAGYLLDDMYVEIIADGIHLPKELLRLIYKIKGADKIILITDSMRASGQKSGISILGSRKNGQEVLIEDGVAKLMDKTAFAGSIATTDRLVRTMVKVVGIDLVSAIRMITKNPATVMGMGDEIGSLKANTRANMTIFDEDINVKFTVIDGCIS